jgi:hypothetical protein
MGIHPTTYVGFGALLSYEKLRVTNENLWDDIEKLYETHPNVEVFTGEGDPVFVTYDGHYFQTDYYTESGAFEVNNITGSTRQVADELRSAVRAIGGGEPMLKTYYAVIWS